ncbi:hypothetical protein [Sinimarinibacterium thermocellulolyticum]|uniref:Uncharacterized protein n=1 Tax=Sinimarinibacterium thermocellulolyticum TaxID=3170016 RepID=A0ABV2A7K0_9GAMM
MNRSSSNPDAATTGNASGSEGKATAGRLSRTQFAGGTCGIATRAALDAQRATPDPCG